jgi:hypothetical protein
MLTKSITYTNFNGDKVTRNFYFNITKAELALRELESDGNWSQTLERIQGSSKGSVVLPEFKKILKWTYGEKSEDGESFIKSEEAWARFENSEPWSELIIELLSDASAAANFINDVLPPDIAARNVEAQKTNGFRPGADTSRPTPPVVGVPLVAPQTTENPNYGTTDAPQTRREVREQESGFTRESQPRENPFQQ